MTKYILNSGGLRKNPENATKFISEIVEGLGKNPRILFCFFAEKRENWEEKYKEYSKGFTGWLGNEIKPNFELAFPDKFIDQVKKANAIYIHGGDDYLLQCWLKQFNLIEIFKNKVVATNSASSDALSKHFWTCDWRKCMDGLGILPIKFIPHYKSDWGDSDPRGLIDWDAAYKELAEYGEKDMPIYALREAEYKVFEIE